MIMTTKITAAVGLTITILIVVDFVIIDIVITETISAN